MYLVVIIIAGSFLSQMAEQRLKSSKKQTINEEQSANDDLEISHLKQHLSNLESQIAENSSTHQADTKNLQLKNQELETTETQKQSLKKSLLSLNASLENLKSEFDTYRLNYRRTFWKQAVGTTLPKINTKNGREFEQVTITRVAADGLEISHKSGTARILTAEIDESLQDRFLLGSYSHDQEFQILNSHHFNPTTTTLKNSPPVSPRITNVDAASDAKIALMRDKVLSARAVVQRLKSQRANALFHTSYGNSKSVPSSLQTWEQRANTLAARIAQEEIILTRALADLAAVSPNDPLIANAQLAEP